MENRQEQVSKQGLSTGKRDQHSSGGSPPNKKKKNRPLEDENEDICVTYSASRDVDSIECESWLKLQHRQCAGMQKSTRYRTRKNFDGGGGGFGEPYSWFHNLWKISTCRESFRRRPVWIKCYGIGFSSRCMWICDEKPISVAFYSFRSSTERFTAS